VVTGLDDDAVGALLTRVERVAVLGVSDRFNRPSFRLAAYLLDRTAWTVDLVNPHVVETLGRLCTPTLDRLPAPPDLVVVFRAPGAWAAVVDEVAAAGGHALWLPGGAETAADPAATAAVLARARAAGLDAVADRDLRAEHRRWCA